MLFNPPRTTDLRDVDHLWREKNTWQVKPRMKQLGVCDAACVACQCILVIIRFLWMGLDPTHVGSFTPWERKT